MDVDMMDDGRGGNSVLMYRQYKSALVVILVVGFALRSLLVSKGTISVLAIKSAAAVTAPPVSGAYRHDFTSVKASTCSEEQMNAISNTLTKPNAWSILTSTSCPQSNWIQKLYKTKLRQDSIDYTFLGINIGCNKGYDAVGMARMGTGNSKFDRTSWHKSMSSFGVSSSGNCGQMNSSQFELDSEERSTSRRGEIHCVEPLPSTVLALKNSSAALGLDEEGFVVTQAAISSSDGTAFFPTPKAGSETGSLASCEVSKNDCTEVPMYSLETYVKNHVKDQGPINILSIDAEGYDFDVMFGAGSVLDRTEYLEFEYHREGNWGHYHLPTAIRLLDGKGFTCYWAGIEVSFIILVLLCFY